MNCLDVTLAAFRCRTHRCGRLSAIPSGIRLAARLGIFLFFIKARIRPLLPRAETSVLLLCVITIQSHFKCIPVTSCYYKLPHSSKTSLDIYRTYLHILQNPWTPSETVRRRFNSLIISMVLNIFVMVYFELLNHVFIFLFVHVFSHAFAFFGLFAFLTAVENNLPREWING